MSFHLAMQSRIWASSVMRVSWPSTIGLIFASTFNAAHIWKVPAAITHYSYSEKSTDFGAPWVHHSTYYDVYHYKYCVGNGGFSLRSKRLCEVASKVYKKWFRHIPYWRYILGDDTFYCKTLRFWFRNAVRDMKWPTPEEACKFSIEHNKDFIPSEAPLGFHSVGFMRYRSFSQA